MLPARRSLFGSCLRDGTFCSISMLPPFWQTATPSNSVAYLVSAFRRTFYGIPDVNVWISLAATLLFRAIVPGSSERAIG